MGCTPAPGGEVNLNSVSLTYVIEDALSHVFSPNSNDRVASLSEVPKCRPVNVIV